MPMFHRPLNQSISLNFLRDDPFYSARKAHRGCLEEGSGVHPSGSSSENADLSVRETMSTEPKEVVARFMLEAMSNLRTRSTGVDDATIWVSAGGFAGAQMQHGPRIKVIPGTKITKEGLLEAASVTITDPPKVIGDLPGKLKKQAIAFVTLNSEILLQYWRNEIDTQDLLEGLTRV